MFVLLLTVAAFAAAALGSEELDPVADQLLLYRDTIEEPNILTTSSGAPVSKCQATNTLNSNLLLNQYAMDLNAHLVRERTPERAVHAKGTGAFGYLEVTHDMSHICKASFLKKGEITPIAMRFSLSSGNLGSSDMVMDSRGYAVKFYTREGNFDIVGFNTDIFSFLEPNLGHTIIHSARRNPATNIKDQNMFWDRLTLVPEALHMNLLLLSGRGIPASYRQMPGFSIHTYQFENKKGERHFVRFHFIPELGIKTLDSDEATKIGATEPDYLTADLYRAIAKGDYPCWNMYLQVMSESQVKKEGPIVFDVTRRISKKKYPLQKVGRLCLNKNAKNWRSEIEQLAFCPCNVIPGIPGAPDKLFEIRTLVYRETQMHRLGKNVNNIPVNCPYRSLTYNRDGVPPLGDNGGDTPNYYPNSFNGPEPYDEKYCSSMLKIRESKPDNFDQARDLYEDELTSEQRDQLIKNLYKQLQPVHKSIQERAIKLFKKIHPNLAHRVAKVLNSTIYEYDD